MPKPDVITYSDPYEPGATEYVPASRLAKKDAQIARLRATLKEIEERTRPEGDMADQAVNDLARAALSA